MKDSDTFLSFSEFKDRYGITETNYLLLIMYLL